MCPGCDELEDNDDYGGGTLTINQQSWAGHVTRWPIRALLLQQHERTSTRGEDRNPRQQNLSDGCFFFSLHRRQLNPQPCYCKTPAGPTSTPGGSCPQTLILKLKKKKKKQRNHWPAVTCTDHQVFFSLVNQHQWAVKFRHVCVCVCVHGLRMTHVKN